jgi:hypothetical protein
LKSIRASGGSAGKSGTSDLPVGVAELSREDINDGFRVTTLMAVNSAELRQGLVFVLGGWLGPFSRTAYPFRRAVVCCLYGELACLEMNSAARAVPFLN